MMIRSRTEPEVTLLQASRDGGWQEQLEANKIYGACEIGRESCPVHACMGHHPQPQVIAVACALQDLRLRDRLSARKDLHFCDKSTCSAFYHDLTRLTEMLTQER